MEQLHNLEHFIIGFWESFIKYKPHESVTLNPSFLFQLTSSDQYQSFIFWKIIDADFKVRAP